MPGRDFYFFEESNDISYDCDFFIMGAAYCIFEVLLSPSKFKLYFSGIPTLLCTYFYFSFDKIILKGEFFSNYGF